MKPGMTAERAFSALGDLGKHVRKWHGVRRDGDAIELACTRCTHATKRIPLASGDEGLYQGMRDFMIEHRHDTGKAT